MFYQEYESVNISQNLIQIFRYFFMNANFHEYILWYTWVFPIFFLMGIISMIVSREQSKNQNLLIFILWFVSFIGYYSTFIFVDVRHFLPMLVPMSIIITYGCIYASSRINNYILKNFYTIEAPSKIKNKKIKKTEKVKKDFITTYVLGIFIFILIFSSVFYIKENVESIKSRGEWSYIKDAGVFIKDNTLDNSIIISLNSYALDFYSRRDVLELDNDSQKIFYMENGLRKNISQLLHENRPLYAVQVNVGYNRFRAREDIMDSYNAIKNISNNYNVILVKEMPTFILYKIENRI